MDRWRKRCTTSSRSSFRRPGVRIFPHDTAEKPLLVSGLTLGTATSDRQVPQPIRLRDFSGAAPGNGPAPGSLDLGVDLSKVPVSGTKVIFLINGLADPAEPSTTFTLPFRLGPAGRHSPGSCRRRSRSRDRRRPIRPRSTPAGLQGQRRAPGIDGHADQGRRTATVRSSCAARVA